jgi:putative membrane protein
MGDKAIISYLIKAHGKAVSLFENAVLDAKDPEIRSFADKTVPLLRTHLESAKELEKKL